MMIEFLIIGSVVAALCFRGRYFPNPETLREDAFAALKLGQLDQAENLFRRFLDRVRGNRLATSTEALDVKLELANLQLLRRGPRAATQVLQMSVESDEWLVRESRLPEITLLEARINLHYGNYDLAIQKACQAIKHARICNRPTVEDSAQLFVAQVFISGEVTMPDFSLETLKLLKARKASGSLGFEADLCYIEILSLLGEHHIAASSLLKPYVTITSHLERGQYELEAGKVAHRARIYSRAKRHLAQALQRFEYCGALYCYHCTGIELARVALADPSTHPGELRLLLATLRSTVPFLTAFGGTEDSALRQTCTLIQAIENHLMSNGARGGVMIVDATDETLLSGSALGAAAVARFRLRATSAKLSGLIIRVFSPLYELFPSLPERPYFELLAGCFFLAIPALDRAWQNLSSALLGLKGDALHTLMCDLALVDLARILGADQLKRKHQDAADALVREHVSLAQEYAYVIALGERFEDGKDYQAALAHYTAAAVVASSGWEQAGFRYYAARAGDLAMASFNETYRAYEDAAQSAIAAGALEIAGGCRLAQAKLLLISDELQLERALELTEEAVQYFERAGVLEHVNVDGAIGRALYCGGQYGLARPYLERAWEKSLERSDNALSISGRRDALDYLRAPYWLLAHTMILQKDYDSMIVLMERHSFFSARRVREFYGSSTPGFERSPLVNAETVMSGLRRNSEAGDGASFILHPLLPGRCIGVVVAGVHAGVFYRWWIETSVTDISLFPHITRLNKNPQSVDLRQWRDALEEISASLLTCTAKIISLEGPRPNGAQTLDEIINELRQMGVTRLMVVLRGLLSRVPLGSLTYWVRGRPRHILEDFEIVRSPTVEEFDLATRRSDGCRLNGAAVGVLSRGETAEYLTADVTEARLAREVFAEAGCTVHYGSLVGKPGTGATDVDDDLESVFGACAHVYLVGHGRMLEADVFRSAVLSLSAERILASEPSLAAEGSTWWLSACVGGLVGSAHRTVDDPISPTTALLCRGAGRVISSQWQVESSATTVLMGLVLRQTLPSASRLSKPPSFASALRNAQLSMLYGRLNDEEIRAVLDCSIERARGLVEEFRSPYFWAAFEVSGAP